MTLASSLGLKKGMPLSEVWDVCQLQEQEAVTGIKSAGLWEGDTCEK